MTAPQHNYNDTVYIRNINEKVSINTIKTKLTELCEPFGPVISVTAHKNLKMRGQAFVALSDETKVQQAVAALNGKELFQKKIEVQVAKSSSNATVEAKLGEKLFTEYMQQRLDYKRALDEKKQKEQTSKPVTVNLDNTPPNKTLLLQDLPKDIQQDELTEVFSKYKGFIEIRLVSVRRVAFVEFSTDKDAIPAKQDNQKLTIRDQKVTVNFAKK